MSKLGLTLRSVVESVEELCWYVVEEQWQSFFLDGPSWKCLDPSYEKGKER